MEVWIKSFHQHSCTQVPQFKCLLPWQQRQACINTDRKSRVTKICYFILCWNEFHGFHLSWRGDSVSSSLNPNRLGNGRDSYHQQAHATIKNRLTHFYFYKCNDTDKLVIPAEQMLDGCRSPPSRPGQGLSSMPALSGQQSDQSLLHLLSGCFRLLEREDRAEIQKKGCFGSRFCSNIWATQTVMRGAECCHGDASWPRTSSSAFLLF